MEKAIENTRQNGMTSGAPRAVAPKCRVWLRLFLVLLLCSVTLASSAQAQVTANAPVFGPQTYVRTTGAPNEYTTTFTVPAWIVSPYDLHIANGDANGNNRISSGTISLNGVEIVGPSDFNQNVATIDRSVTLQSTNTLQVTLASKPGSYLTINVFGTSADHTPPQIKIVAPSAGYTNSATPTIEVTYSDPIGAGQFAASGVDTATFKATLDGVDRTSLFTVRTTDASATIPANLSLSVGAHTLVISLEDNAGNQAAATSQFTVDLGTPQIQITQPVLGAYLKTETPTISIQYSDSVGLNLSTLKVLINGADETSLFTKTSSGATATLPLANALANGAVKIVAQIQNLAGTSASASTSFNIDTTPPTISFSHPTPNSYHGSSTVDIGVEYTDDQAIDTTKLQITLDGVPVSTSNTQTSATGSVASVANGAHTLFASIADLAGNVSSTQITFYIDTTVPTIHISQPAPNVIVSTHTPQISIDYSDIQGVDTTTLKIFVNGTDLTSLFSVGPSGATAQLSGTATLSDGPNTITAQIANLAGTVGEATSNFMVDTIAPTIVFQAPPAQTNSNAPGVTIVYSDSGSGVNPYSLKVALDGADVSTLIAPGATSATGVLQTNPPLADGAHQLSATVADRAGNTSQPATLSFVVDTKPPVLTFASPLNNSFGNNPTPSLVLDYNDGTGTGVDPSSIKVQLQQNTNLPADITTDFTQITPHEATGSIPQSASLSDGTYSLTAVASDVVGNQGTANATFVVDTVPPTGAIQAPAANAILNTARANAIITYQDDRSGVDTSKLVLAVDGINQTAILATTPTQATGTLPPLPDGTHTIQLTVFDRAGNSIGPISQTFTTDTTAPTIAVSVSPSPNSAGWNNSSVTVGFACSDTGSGVSTCPAPIAVATEAANQQFCGEAVDAAGNTSAPACATVNIDKTPPTISYTISPTPNANGINTTTPVTITFQCGDTLSGVASCPAPIIVNNPGLNQSFPGTATDVAGNTATTTATVSIQTAAPTPPSIAARVSPSPNARGWNNSTVTVTFSCTPGANLIASCPSPVMVNTEGANQSVCGEALDTTGLKASTCAHVSLDMTPPAITATPSPVPSGSGWNNTPVTVSFNCSDTLSGVATCPPPQTISTDGANQAVSGTASDAAGNNGTARATVNLDQTPPSILQFNAPNQISPGQTGTASVTTTDNLSGVSAVVFQLNGATLATLNAPPYTVDFTAPSTANAGDTLTLTVSVSDVAGNANSSARGIQVVLAGVVTGQVLSDTTGLPLAGASVQIVGASSGGQDTSDNNGRYSIPSNTSHLFLSIGTTPNAAAGVPATVTVERELFLESGVGTVPVDARMTPIAPAASINSSGGSLTSGTITLALAAGAVSSATNFYLTSLSQQGLPGLLPLGWSPVVAFDLRSDSATAASFNATIAHLSASLSFHLLRYNYNTHAWLMVTPNLTATNGTLSIQVPSLGDFALAVADAGSSTPTIPAAGQALTGVTMVTLPAGTTASGTLNPPSVSPIGGTSMASLAVQSSVPLPSGTVIQANVLETYSLASGKQLSDAQRTEDILLYQYAAPSGAAAAANFPVTPAQTFQPEQLSSGNVHLDILSGREAIRGLVGGSDSATVTGGDATLLIAAGSLPQDTAIAVAPETIDGFLPSTGSLIPLAEYNIDFSGQVLNSAAQLSVAAGTAKQGDNVFLAQIQRVNGVPYLVVVSFAQVNGTNLVTEAAPGLSGVTQGGDYVFYKVTSPTGYVSGTVTAATGPVAASIQTDGLPFVVFSNFSGAYVIPAVAGTVNVTASVPNTALSATATVQVAAGQTTTASLTVFGQTESATITPPNGAVGVPLTAEIDITAPDAFNQATVTTTSVTLTQNGQGSNTLVPIRFVFSQAGTRLSVFPQSALQPSTTYTLAASGIANNLGGLIAVPTITFTTQANTPPNFNTNALVFGMPDQNGNTQISAPANSFPPGTTILIVDQTNGVVLSLTVANDGSVTGQMPATIDDILAVTITAPDKTTATFTRSQFVAPDGTTAVGPGGGTVTGPGNTAIIIPQGALTKGTTFKLDLLDQTAFPQLPNWPGANFGSGIQITAPAMPSFNKEAKLAFPVPANAPPGAFYYVYRRLVDPNDSTKVLFETIDHAFVQGTGSSAQVVTASPPFCGYMNSFGNFQAVAAASYQPLQTAITFTFMMWDYDPNQAGVASQGLLAGRVFQNDANGNPGPLLNGAIATITLTDNPQYMTTTTPVCGTYSLFDPQRGGGTRSLTATATLPTFDPSTGNTVTQTQTIVATSAEVNGIQPDDNLFSVAAGLYNQYRNIGRFNFTFAPATPPPPPPQINIGIYAVDGSGNRQPASGIIQSGTSLTITFSSTLTVIGATINGGTVSSVVADTPPAKPVKGLIYTRLLDPYIAGTPALYTITATGANPLNPNSPINVSRSFLVVGQGGGNAFATDNQFPAVVATSPENYAQGVPTSIFPQITFSEPVTNVPGNVALRGSPQGDTPSFILIGVKPDGTVANPVKASDYITSLTIQPLTGLEFNETYVVTLTNGILGLGKDQNGNAIPLVTFTLPFTTFGPQGLGGTSSQYSLITRPAIIGKRAYAGEFVGAVNSGVGVFDISDPSKPRDLGPSASFIGRAIDTAGQQRSPVTGGGLIALSAAAEQNLAIPGNVWLYGVPSECANTQAPPVCPAPNRVGAVSVTSSATQAGIALRLVVKDSYLYASTLYQGLQVIDLNQAVSEYRDIFNTNPTQFGVAVSTEGDGFATDAVVNTIQLPNPSGGTYTMLGLAVDDFATSGSGGAGATQVLLVATGPAPFVVADPSLSGSTAVVYPPGSLNAPLQMTTHDGTTYQMTYGRAVAIGTIPYTDSTGNSTNKHVAVVVGSGTVTTGGASGTAPLLAVVDMTQAYAPGSPYPATPIGFLQLPTGGTDVKLNGSTALLATGTDVLLVNLANPFQPVVAGTITGTFGNWLTLTSDGFLVAANNTRSPSSIQTATFQAVVTTRCPSPISAALISGTPLQNPVYKTFAPVTCAIQVVPSDTPASSANFTLTQTDGTLIASMNNVPLVGGAGSVQLPANLTIRGDLLYAQSTAMNTQDNQPITPLTQTVTVGGIHLVVDSNNDTNIDPMADSLAAQAGKKFSFWQKDPSNIDNNGQDALVDFAPVRVYVSSLPDPSLGKIELLLTSAKYNATFLLTKNLAVPDGATDDVAAKSEKLYLTDQNTALNQVAVTNKAGYPCGYGVTFENTLCESVPIGGDLTKPAVELDNLQNGQMYDVLLSVNGIDCTPSSGSSTCPPVAPDGSGVLEVVLLKSDNSILVLDQVPVDLRPLQNWMSVFTARSGSPVPLSDAVLLPAWTDIPASATSVNILVHGYSVSEEDATQNFLPSWFKRLYWTGRPTLLAQGNTHTVGFSWSGDLSLLNWPDDEYSALECGVPLARFLSAQASAGRAIRLVAHSLGNMVVNSALIRPEAQSAVSSGSVKSFVMNEAAVPGEVFDSSYATTDLDAYLVNLAQNSQGYPNDNIWQLEWDDMQTNGLANQWNNTLGAADYLTRPQPLYYSRWTQQRPASGVPDSASPLSAPQRGPWLGLFAVNPGKVTITNTFSTHDTVLSVIWYVAESTEKPNNLGNPNGTSTIPGVSIIPDNETQQYWARLSNTDGSQEEIWGNYCATASFCQHSNIIRQWAELAYWFPAVSTAIGSHVVNALTNIDFTPYDPALKFPTATHSNLKLAPYPQVFPAWQMIGGAMK